MKNSSTKKWLTVAGCLALCAVLVVLIAGKFGKEPVEDNPAPPASSQQHGDVVVGGPDSAPTDSPEKKDDTEVKPEQPDVTSSTGGDGAVSTGTEQTIQPDVVKPDPDEEDLKDPAKKPDGTPVEGAPKSEDHNNVTPPPPPPSTNTGGGLPGFDNVPDAGPNQGEYVDGDGDINKQVGIMG